MLYNWILAFHIIAVISWMVGLLYIPRLFVYHCQIQNKNEEVRFITMERRLYRFIMTPAMLVSLACGVMLIILMPSLLQEGWLHVKFLALLVLFAFHGFLGRWRKAFEAGKNRHSERFYRIMNEVPTLLMILIVIMVIVKPL